MPGEARNFLTYSAVYRHGIDDKRRVQIPSKWRSPENDILTLLVWPKAGVPDVCLLVLPPPQWEALVNKVREMPYSNSDAENLRLLLGSKSDQVSVDKNGRACIPEWMTKAVDIGKEVIMTGLVDRFEIWKPERYEASMASAQAGMAAAYKMI